MWLILPMIHTPSCKVSKEIKQPTVFQDFSKLHTTHVEKVMLKRSKCNLHYVHSYIVEGSLFQQKIIIFVQLWLRVIPTVVKTRLNPTWKLHSSHDKDEIEHLLHVMGPESSKSPKIFTKENNSTWVWRCGWWDQWCKMGDRTHFDVSH